MRVAFDPPIKLSLRTWTDQAEQDLCAAIGVCAIEMNEAGDIAVTQAITGRVIRAPQGRWELASFSNRIAFNERMGTEREHRACLKVDRDSPHIDRKFADMERRLAVLEEQVAALDRRTMGSIRMGPGGIAIDF